MAKGKEAATLDDVLKTLKQILAQLKYLRADLNIRQGVGPDRQEDRDSNQE